MGYSVAIMADSTSRWAEALLEMSGRLEEMPGDEGYPAYLAAAWQSIMSCSGKAICLGSDQEGSITAISAVSPSGRRYFRTSYPKIRCGSLKSLGLRCHLSAKASFSIDRLVEELLFIRKRIGGLLDQQMQVDWSKQVTEAHADAAKNLSCQIIRLVGIDALSEKDQLLLETTKSLREDFLQQNAFDDVDTFTSREK